MKKMFTAFGVTALLVTSAFMFTGCGNGAKDSAASATTPAESTVPQASADSATPSTPVNNSVLIGVSLSSADEFNTNLKIKYEKYADSIDGVKLVFANAGGVASQQTSDVENLISQNCDVIVIRAVDGDAIVTACDSVKNAGIKLVIDETRVAAKSYDVRVTGDQANHGKLLGTYIDGLKTSGKISDTKIGYIAGLSSANILKRKTGILETCPSAQFVVGGAEGYALANNWSTAEAQNLVENWISSDQIKDINVIACMNDELASAAIAAIGTNYPEIVVLGVDGSSIGQQNIRDGKMMATTYQDSSISAQKVIDVCIALKNGTALEFSDAENRLIDPENIFLMTKENIDELLNK